MERVRRENLIYHDGHIEVIIKLGKGVLEKIFIFLFHGHLLKYYKIKQYNNAEL